MRISDWSSDVCSSDLMIDIEIDGQKYQEMHVDGGAMAQVFLYPPSLKLKEQAAAIGMVRDRHVYIVRNARLDPDWADVERRTFSIAGRAISPLIPNPGIGALYRLSMAMQRAAIGYNSASLRLT